MLPITFSLFPPLTSYVLRLTSCVLRLASCVLRLASYVLRLFMTPNALVSFWERHCYICSLSHSYCFSDQGDLTIFNPTAGVFGVRAVARYRLNFYDAEHVCELLGASLATYGQLYAAWAAGLEHCA